MNRIIQWVFTATLAICGVGSVQAQVMKAADLEKYDPRSKKSAFFYTGPESLYRPEVLRHMQKLREMPKKYIFVLIMNKN